MFTKALFLEAVICGSLVHRCVTVRPAELSNDGVMDHEERGSLQGSQSLMSVDSSNASSQIGHVATSGSLDLEKCLASIKKRLADTTGVLRGGGVVGDIKTGWRSFVDSFGDVVIAAEIDNHHRKAKWQRIYESLSAIVNLHTVWSQRFSALAEHSRGLPEFEVWSKIKTELWRFAHSWSLKEGEELESMSWVSLGYVVPLVELYDSASLEAAEKAFDKYPRAFPETEAKEYVSPRHVFTKWFTQPQSAVALQMRSTLVAVWGDCVEYPGIDDLLTLFQDVCADWSTERPPNPVFAKDIRVRRAQHSYDWKHSGKWETSWLVAKLAGEIKRFKVPQRPRYQTLERTVWSQTDPVSSQEELEGYATRSSLLSFLNIDNSPVDVHDIFCPLVSAAKAFGLNKVTRLRGEGGAAHATAGELPKAGKCAVVSNSGVLLNHKHGQEIDSADMVFRFNDAMIGGEFTETVGERDDIRIVNGEFGERVLQGEMKVEPGTEYVILRPLHKQLDQATEAQGEHEEAHIVLGSGQLAKSAMPLLSHFYQEGLKGMLTSGFLGIGLALTLCDEVRAYGFADTPGSDAAPFHYFGDKKEGSANRNPQHRLANKEREFWRKVSLNADVNTTDVSVLPGVRQLRCANV
mmetsp:Transcript_63078/g.150337  ORF Transcript_63078/g.150337 Transcript_63078/m.150337 type:complete len:634 (-) Transcript_63078:305-2206(-)|eukprot:CAMPEP_0178435724 /NCGR_PEP_ID=MMETSP0689_2-20121128/34077_1 /TAXON_ID=160604 /ORGANISM="Amphidinium massartii, Strain CS-259" /LENGTH=633 /DNA_ID=CAMNT_0020057809 /DNA_START=151 /DNA_END=2052 /DNA_ORIENTATION=-